MDVAVDTRAPCYDSWTMGVDFEKATTIKKSLVSATSKDMLSRRPSVLKDVFVRCDAILKVPYMVRPRRNNLISVANIYDLFRDSSDLRPHRNITSLFFFVLFCAVACSQQKSAI